MNREQYLLGKLAEEAAEIAQIALKTQQFGFDSINPKTNLSNLKALRSELDDLIVILALLREDETFSYDPNNDYIRTKSGKVNKYYQLSKECGRST